MEGKDYLLEIYKVEADKYNKTRDIHWKMNIAIWSVLIVAIYGKSQFGLTISPMRQIVILVYSLVTSVQISFIILIHGSLHRSLNRMKNMVVFILEKSPQEIIKWREMEKITFKKSIFWESWQVAITILLIFIFDKIPILHH